MIAKVGTLGEAVWMADPCVRLVCQINTSVYGSVFARSIISPYRTRELGFAALDGLPHTNVRPPRRTSRARIRRGHLSPLHALAKRQIVRKRSAPAPCLVRRRIVVIAGAAYLLFSEKWR